MKELLIITFSFLITSFYFAQERSLDMIDSDTTIYQKVDLSATFPGGGIRMNRYLFENIVYPNELTQNLIQGRYYVQFVIEKNGRITNIKPVKIKNHPTNLDILFVNENRLVFSNMPRWSPSILDGKKVRSYYIIPFTICVGK